MNMLIAKSSSPTIHLSTLSLPDLLHLHPRSLAVMLVKITREQLLFILVSLTNFSMGSSPLMMFSPVSKHLSQLPKLQHYDEPLIYPLLQEYRNSTTPAVASTSTQLALRSLQETSSAHISTKVSLLIP